MLWGVCVEILLTLAFFSNFLYLFVLHFVQILFFFLWIKFLFTCLWFVKPLFRQLNLQDNKHVAETLLLFFSLDRAANLNNNEKKPVICQVWAAILPFLLTLYPSSWEISRKQRGITRYGKFQHTPWGGWVWRQDLLLLPCLVPVQWVESV